MPKLAPLALECFIAFLVCLAIAYVAKVIAASIPQSLVDDNAVKSAESLVEEQNRHRKGAILY